MCRVATARTRCSPRAAAEARHFLTAKLSTWAVDEVAFPALRATGELLTSELVTNAVLHAGSDIGVTIGLAGDVLEIGISDADQRSAPALEQACERLRRGQGAPPSAEHGRGLQLLHALAHEWGISVLPDGKQVWFTLPVPRWSPAADCACAGGHLDSLVLGSGRRVLHMLSA